MDEFGYIIDKIRSAKFTLSPFKFIQINNFLSGEHFNQIISAPEINRPVFSDTASLINDLQQTGYKVQGFPGCSSSIKEYLSCYKSNNWPVDKNLLAGFGLTFRMEHYKTPLLEKFVDFLNSVKFKTTLEEKFGITRSNYVETAIQKYLHGYEISPHPDIRQKCLTYMLNINTSNESEQIPIHTYLLKFKPERQYIYDFWKYNTEVDRCWVPWDWCESNFEANANNSIVIFSPSDDTLHAVKLRYDHLKFQRTQVYGNLWFDESLVKYKLEYDDIDLLAKAASKEANARKPVLRFKKFIKQFLS